MSNKVYIEILESLAKRHDIRFRSITYLARPTFLSNLLGDGFSSNFKTREVFIDFAQVNNTYNFISALHEIGHIVLKHIPRSKSIRFSSNHQDRIIKEEQEAWHYAIRLSSELGFEPSVRELRLCKYNLYTYIFDFEALARNLLTKEYVEEKIYALVQSDNRRK